MTDTATFKREERYIVIKRKHMSESQERDLREGMRLRGIGTVECVVVEADWPEYETVWQLIEDRVTGNTRLASTPQPSGELINAARFMLDRLVDHEVRMTSEEDAREWSGHVTPAMARLRALTDPGSSQPSDMIGEAVAAERERCAKIAENFTRAGRGWVKDSLWDNITKGIAAAIRLPTATEGERS